MGQFQEDAEKRRCQAGSGCQVKPRLGHNLFKNQQPIFDQKPLPSTLLLISTQEKRSLDLFSWAAVFRCK